MLLKKRRVRMLEKWLNCWIEKINQIYGINLERLKLDIFKSPKHNHLEALSFRIDNELFISDKLLENNDNYVKAYLLYEVEKSLPKIGRSWITVEKEILKVEGKAVYDKIQEIEKMSTGEG